MADCKRCIEERNRKKEMLKLKSGCEFYKAYCFVFISMLSAVFYVLTDEVFGVFLTGVFIACVCYHSYRMLRFDNEWGRI